ncbi:hypothetical protein [Desulfovibrio oxyclinae]|jgi:nicotinamide-nucleotide adenylyltransferase|uniref:hypothetical protein n=1 Tax=Desulfovibrio oxyclinae TaxID=63560 RepID=UPI00036CECA2|nr:hypothetical protein [Desulfovibrio oxyclinae]
MHPLGVIHGRFQVLHVDHLKYLLAGKRLCEHLVVGITNPDPELTAGEAADPERDDPRNNPLTYWERQVMVREVLTGAGVDPGDFSVVPLPINKPERIRYYVPMDALFFLTIYDEWGRAKLRRFRALELDTHVLWERPPEEKGISAGTVREALARGEDVSSMVPPETLRLVKRWGLAQRLREIGE